MTRRWLATALSVLIILATQYYSIKMSPPPTPDAALDAPSLRHAIELENRTQILSGFTNNPTEAAKAHREKRAPKWDPL